MTAGVWVHYQYLLECRRIPSEEHSGWRDAHLIGAAAFRLRSAGRAETHVPVGVSVGRWRDKSGPRRVTPSIGVLHWRNQWQLGSRESAGSKPRRGDGTSLCTKKFRWGALENFLGQKFWELSTENQAKISIKEFHFPGAKLGENFLGLATPPLGGEGGG